MKYIPKYLLTAIAAFSVLAGCEKADENQFKGIDGPHIALNIYTCNPALQVRADMPGEDTYHENLLNSVYYFFYKNGVTDAPAIVQGYAAGLSTSGSHTELIPISANDLNNELFDGDRNCSLFVIANPTESMNTLLSGTPTLAQLRAASVISQMDKVQDNFVMVFDDEVTLQSRVEDDAIVAEAGLKRLACKFTFKADVKKTIETTDGSKTITWTASTDANALSVTLGNAINATTPSGFLKSAVSDGDYYESTPMPLAYQTGADKTIDSELYQTYTAEGPVYSYPMNWIFTDKYEPYLLFDLTWIYDDGADQHPEHRYYKLVLGQQSITANDWYVITAKLSGLGNLLPRDPLVEFNNLNYLVSSWSNAFPDNDNPNTSTNIKATRFLMVPQTTWEMNNIEDLDIPFTTSHDCEIVDFTATKTQFYDKSNTNTTEFNNPNRPKTDIDASAGFTYDIVDNKSIHIHNDLDNDVTSSTFDCSPIVIQFKIRHKDDHTKIETVNLTQYPAIWIETVMNTSGWSDTNTYKGFLYVNGTTEQGSGNQWNRVLGAATGQTANNTSRYFTIIHISQFENPNFFNPSYFEQSEFGSDFEFNYIIGDPRSRTIDNLHVDGDWVADQYKTSWSEPDCVTAPAKYGTSPRKLAYYYPAMDDKAHFTYIAPVLRVNTGHSHQSTYTSYEDAKKRCATYQEDGYPAGRWRLPTMAEMFLINTLSNNGIIPSIYTGSQYWFAGGYFNGDNAGDDMYKASVANSIVRNQSTRCVYDEWYWAQVDAEKGWTNSNSGIDWSTTAGAGKGFVWGDVPRNY